jgi:hypothetical protein
VNPVQNFWFYLSKSFDDQLLIKGINLIATYQAGTIEGSSDLSQDYR